jgi:hypothetical protein
VHVDRHGEDTYGLDLVREHVKGVLYPFLAPLVRDGGVDLVYAAKDGEVESFLRPVLPEGLEDDVEDDVEVAEVAERRKTYRLHLERLRMMVWIWLGTMSGEVRAHRVREHVSLPAPPLRDGEMLSAVAGLVRDVVTFDLEGLMHTLDRTVHLPDHRETIRWIRDCLSRGIPFRMTLDGVYSEQCAFLVFTTITHGADGRVTYVSVRGVDNPDRRLYSQLTGIEVVPTPPERTLEHFLAGGRLPGCLDPATVMQVVRAREEGKGVSAYGIEAVRKYLVDRTADYVVGANLVDYRQFWTRALRTLTTDDVRDGKMALLLPSKAELGLRGVPAVERYLRDQVKLVLNVRVWLGGADTVIGSWIAHPDWLAELPAEVRDEVLLERTRAVLLEGRAAYLALC